MFNSGKDAKICYFNIFILTAGQVYVFCNKSKYGLDVGGPTHGKEIPRVGDQSELNSQAYLKIRELRTHDPNSVNPLFQSSRILNPKSKARDHT